MVLPPLPTWCNKRMANKRENLEVDDMLVALPQDARELIIKKLDFVDYIRISVVSKLWRSIAFAAKQSSDFFLSQLPWLVMSFSKGDVLDFHHEFFSLSHNKIFELKSPEMGGACARCCGSSFGWLIMVKELRSIFLVHPFSRVQIPLPSPISAVHIRKAILTSAPINSNSSSQVADNCLVVALYVSSYLCFCRLGDKAWTLFKWSNHFEDIRSYNGRLYAIDKYFNFIILDLQGSHPRGTKIDIPCVVGRVSIFESVCNYLVESLGGDLLMVVRRRKDSRCYDMSKTYRFDIFKLDLTGDPNWIRVENFGNEMLFVDTRGGIFVSATNFSSGLFQGNRIYFSDDDFATLSYMNLDKSQGCHDIGMLGIKDQSRESFFPIRFYSSFSAPIWFLPR